MRLILTLASRYSTLRLHCPDSSRDCLAIRIASTYSATPPPSR
nr:MAG TPA: hypothetical protein [Caudoviricetes sp.]